MTTLAPRPPTQVATVSLSTGALQTVMNDGQPWIVFRPAVEGIGLDYSTQLRKLKSRTWANRGDMTTVAEDGRLRPMVTVDLPTFLMWLATVNETKVAPEVRPVLVAYQRETTSAVHSYWTTGVVVRPEDNGRQLTQVKRLTPTTFRQIYFSDVPEGRFFQHLYDHGHLLDQRYQRRDEFGNFTKHGFRHGHPKAGKGDKYFQLPEDMYPDRNGRLRGRAVIRPDRIQDLVEQLIAEGLRHNPSISRPTERRAITAPDAVIEGRPITVRRGA
jgi:hypothetical protein